MWSLLKLLSWTCRWLLSYHILTQLSNLSPCTETPPNDHILTYLFEEPISKSDRILTRALLRNSSQHVIPLHNSGDNNCSQKITSAFKNLCPILSLKKHDLIRTYPPQAAVVSVLRTEGTKCCSNLQFSWQIVDVELEPGKLCS